MTTYEQLMQLMRDTGHFVEGKDSLPARKLHSYRERPFTPEHIIGLYLHSALSHTPRPHFFTDGEKIYYPEEGSSATPSYNLPPDKKEDILREDEVLKSMGAAPRTYSGLYEEIGGHYRVARFDDLFSNGAPRQSYEEFLKQASQGVPYKTIQQQEQSMIKRRMARNRGSIQQLLDTLKREAAPLPNYARRLEETLGRYGYDPAKSK